MSLTDVPQILVFAGPNGSGKSSVTAAWRTVGLYINADDIKARRGSTDLEAAREAERLRELHLAERSVLGRLNLLAVLIRAGGLLKKRPGLFLGLAALAAAPAAILLLPPALGGAGSAIPPVWEGLPELLFTDFIWRPFYILVIFLAAFVFFPPALAALGALALGAWEILAGRSPSWKDLWRAAWSGLGRSFFLSFSLALLALVALILTWALHAPFWLYHLGDNPILNEPAPLWDWLQAASLYIYTGICIWLLGAAAVAAPAGAIEATVAIFIAELLLAAPAARGRPAGISRLPAEIGASFLSLARQGLDAFAAVERSVALTRGSRLKIFIMSLATLALLPTLLEVAARLGGAPFAAALAAGAVLWFAAAFGGLALGVLYHDLRALEKNRNSRETPPPDGGRPDGAGTAQA